MKVSMQVQIFIVIYTDYYNYQLLPLVPLLSQEYVPISEHCRASDCFLSSWMSQGHLKIVVIFHLLSPFLWYFNF